MVTPGLLFLPRPNGWISTLRLGKRNLKQDRECTASVLHARSSQDPGPRTRVGSRVPEESAGPDRQPHTHRLRRYRLPGAAPAHRPPPLPRPRPLDRLCPCHWIELLGAELCAAFGKAIGYELDTQDLCGPAPGAAPSPEAELESRHLLLDLCGLPRLCHQQEDAAAWCHRVRAQS